MKLQSHWSTRYAEVRMQLSINMARNTNMKRNERKKDAVITEGAGKILINQQRLAINESELNPEKGKDSQVQVKHRAKERTFREGENYA